MKLLIGDNLPSDFFPMVIKEAQKNNTKFVTMPPNYTHFCQPLDVAVFGPAKRLWRKTSISGGQKPRQKEPFQKANFLVC